MKSATEQQLQVSIDFEHFPDKYTCKGEDISPQVRVNGAEMPYLAMILDDPDAPDRPYTHWVIWNIRSDLGIPEKVSRVDHPPEIDGAVQGVNTGLGIGYTGPCPPRGQTHLYIFKVYGFAEPLALKAGANRKDLLKALEGKVEQYGEAVATFSR